MTELGNLDTCEHCLGNNMLLELMILVFFYNQRSISVYLDWIFRNIFLTFYYLTRLMEDLISVNYSEQSPAAAKNNF